MELLLPDTQMVDSAGLRLALRGTTLKGTAGELTSGTYNYQGGVYLGIALGEVPYGLVADLWWSRATDPAGGRIASGEVVRGDKLQVIGNMEADGSVSLVEVHHVPVEN